MTTEERYCNHRWHASRIEADTLPVEHVCNLTIGHWGVHFCPCGAIDFNPHFSLDAL
jgi:hypothetical protein